MQNKTEPNTETYIICEYCILSEHFNYKEILYGLFWWLGSKKSACQCRRCGFNPWVRKIPWSRKWQPTLIFLPGKSHGQRSLASYSPWGLKEPDMTQRLSTRSNLQSQLGLRTWHLRILWPEVKSAQGFCRERVVSFHNGCFLEFLLLFT